MATVNFESLTKLDTYVCFQAWLDVIRTFGKRSEITKVNPSNIESLFAGLTTFHLEVKSGIKEGKALKLGAKLGFSVIPCEANETNPRVKHYLFTR